MIKITFEQNEVFFLLFQIFDNPKMKHIKVSIQQIANYHTQHFIIFLSIFFTHLSSAFFIFLLKLNAFNKFDLLHFKV